METRGKVGEGKVSHGERKRAEEGELGKPFRTEDSEFTEGDWMGNGVALASAFSNSCGGQ